MGSSYRQDLKNGSMNEWEEPLREACELISKVQREIYDRIYDTGQFDNAADDGALAEKLGIAKQFILEELPRTPKIDELAYEYADKIRSSPEFEDVNAELIAMVYKAGAKAL